METREILLEADKVSVVFERLADGKIRVTASCWDDAKVIWQNQVLEVAVIASRSVWCECGRSGGARSC